jgi:hypothetical protein
MLVLLRHEVIPNARGMRFSERSATRKFATKNTSR